MNFKRIALRQDYATALDKLADLVFDLTPAGEVAYRQQEREVKRLHDALFEDQQALFDLAGDEFDPAPGRGEIGELGDDLPPNEKPAERLPWE